MFTLSYILAAALLVGEPGETDLVDPTLFHLTNFAAQQIAIEWEIMDPNEARYMLVWAEDFQHDLRLLRTRKRELSKAPFASDAFRFPDRDTANEFISFNRAYRDYIELTMAMQPHRYWDFKAALQETDYLKDVWVLIRDSRCDYYSVITRRQALENLRDRIGVEAYYSDNLPPYVPLWRFQQIR